MAFTIADLGIRDRDYRSYGETISGTGVYATGSLITVNVVLCGVSGGVAFPLLCSPAGALVTKT